MGVTVEHRSDLMRLQRALEAVSEELDAIERRSHWPLRAAAENLCEKPPQSIETCVGHFAFAVRRGSLA